MLITAKPTNYIYPPRTTNTIPIDQIHTFAKPNWIGQLKYNDTRIVIKINPGNRNLEPPQKQTKLHPNPRTPTRNKHPNRKTQHHHLHPPRRRPTQRQTHRHQKHHRHLGHPSTQRTTPTRHKIHRPLQHHQKHHHRHPIHPQQPQNRPKNHKQHHHTRKHRPRKLDEHLEHHPRNQQTLQNPIN